MPVPCADSGHSAGLASRSTHARLRRVASGAGGGKEEKLHATCAHSPLLTLCLRLGSESDVCLSCMQECGAWAGYGDGDACLRPCWRLRRALMGNESQGSSLVVAMLVARNVPFCHATPRTSAQCVSCIQTPGASLASGGLSLRRCMMVLGCRSGGVRVASSRPRKSHEPKLKHSCGRRCLLPRLSERCAAAGGLAAPLRCA